MPDLQSFLQLLAVLAAGRALLSLLPAGRPGGHALGELPATLATSWLLGMLLLSVSWHLELPTYKTAIAFALAVTVGWQLFGTGALVPRHSQQLEPRGWVGWLPWILPAVWLIDAFPARPSGVWMLVASRIAAFVLIERGLRQARCAPALTASALGIVGFWPVIGPFGLPGGLILGAAAALSSGWILRAERRALWLTACVFAMPPTGWIAFALPLGVLAWSPAPLRRRSLLPLGLGALGVAIQWLHGDTSLPSYPPAFPRNLMDLAPAAFVAIAMTTGRRT